MRHKISLNNKGLTRTYSGSVTATEYQFAVIRLMNSEGFEDIRYVINDFSDASFDKEFGEAINFAAAYNVAARMTNQYFRKAYVTQDDELGKIIKASFASFGHKNAFVDVFENMEKALAFVEQV